jgi:hypothetical protein
MFLREDQFYRYPNDPIAQFFNNRRDIGLKGPLSVREVIELSDLQRACILHREQGAIQCSGQSGTWTDQIFSQTLAYNAVSNATSGTETGLLQGQTVQPVLNAGYFMVPMVAPGKAIKVIAQGVVGTTGTPTLVLQARLGSGSGPTNFGGGSIGVSPSITMASSISNKYWRMELDLTCTVVGIGSNNTTLSGAGYFMILSGASGAPAIYAMEMTTPDTATWTNAAFDASVANYINLSVTWTATPSSSNTITVKTLNVLGLN